MKNTEIKLKLKEVLDRYENYLVPSGKNINPLSQQETIELICLIFTEEYKNNE